MKKGEFKINGVSSLEFKALIQERPNIPSANRKINIKQIPGVSGDYIFDEEAYENVSFSLSCFVTGKDEDELKANKEALVNLFNTGQYVEMELYHDNDYIYEVIPISEIDYQPDGKTPLLLPFSISFTAKPFKRVKHVERKTGRSITIHNPYPYASKPEIKLYGTGELSLFVNDNEYLFGNIDDHVVLDSEVEHAYKQENTRIVSRNNRMYTHSFPKLESGTNTITTNGGTNIEVQPRWVVKL